MTCRLLFKRHECKGYNRLYDGDITVNMITPYRILLQSARTRDRLHDKIILKYESKERCMEFWTVLLWITTGLVLLSCTTAKTFLALQRAVRFLHDRVSITFSRRSRFSEVRGGAISYIALSGMLITNYKLRRVWTVILLYKSQNVPAGTKE
jgi:hypothetical protein